VGASVANPLDKNTYHTGALRVGHAFGERGEALKNWGGRRFFARKNLRSTGGEGRKYVLCERQADQLGHLKTNKGSPGRGCENSIRTRGTKGDLDKSNNGLL